MYWLDNATGVAAPPTIPPVASPTKLYFTEGGGGEQPSIPGAEWFNMITDELLQVLSLAGISPDKADHAQLAKAIQSIAFSAYPVGAPIPWPTAVPPSGFLAMTGQSFSATTYPKLALAYPTLVLPDMRAEFIRGWDNGRGVDVGRALLSAQGDAIRNITGAISEVRSSFAGAGFLMVGHSGALVARPTPTRNIMNASSLPVTTETNPINGVTFDASAVVPTATENRPRSNSFNYIVRAA